MKKPGRALPSGFGSLIGMQVAFVFPFVDGFTILIPFDELGIHVSIVEVVADHFPNEPIFVHSIQGIIQVGGQSFYPEAFALCRRLHISP